MSSVAVERSNVIWCDSDAMERFRNKYLNKCCKKYSRQIEIQILAISYSDQCHVQLHDCQRLNADVLSLQSSVLSYAQRQIASSDRHATLTVLLCSAFCGSTQTLVTILSTDFEWRHCCQSESVELQL